MLAAALVLCQLPALAQRAAGSIAGEVADKSGAVVPGAVVTVRNEANNSTFDGVTNSSGVFSFPTILPGSYTVTVSAPGLQTYEMQHIVVTQGAAVGIPTIILQVATTKEQIEVVSSGEAAVPIDSPQASQTLNQTMITDLSIVGRDAAELMKIMPGMGMNTMGQSMYSSYTTQINSGPIGQFSANGTQPNGAVTMTSDGASLLDPGNQGTQTANINQNQVAEVSILTSAYDASFAKGPVTFQAYGKSGSAQFHGQAYLYARNGAFNSIDANDKAQGLKPISDSFYYPGGDFGGPVLIPHTKFNRNRDKLFFYGAFEYMKQQPAGTSYNFFVPTSQMLAGNFSPAYIASLGPGYANAHSNGAVIPCASASTGNGCGSLSNIVGGMIPQSLIDPSSAALLSLFPAANLNPATNATGSNYDYFLGPPVNHWELRLRGDYNISDKTKLYFSWNHQHEVDQNPFYVWWWGSPSTLPYPSPQVADQVSQVYSANMVHVFSPTLTNEFVFADAKFSNPVILTDPNAVNPANIKGFSFTGFFKDPFTQQIPDFFGFNNITSGFFTEQYGSVFQGMQNAFGKISNTPNISDNINYVVGQHTLKAGFYWDFAQNYQSSTGVETTMGGNDFESYGATSTGNPLADEIIGHSSQFSQTNGGVTENFKYYTYGFYVNDAWKASRRLTLTLGIRFDHLGNWAPANCPGYPVGTTQISPCPGLAVWDPAAYVNSASSTIPWNGVQWHAINPAIPMSGFPSKPLFPLPRVGAAYDIFGDGKTVVRGGIGLYRYQLSYNSVSGSAFNAPVNVEGLSSVYGCCVGWNNFSAYSPASGVPGEGSSASGILQMGDERTPYTWTYNLTIDQRLPGRSVLEVQYSGNKSRDELLQSNNGQISDIDIPALGAYFRPDPITGRPGGIMGNAASFNNFPVNDYLPLQFYNAMILVTHGSYANYNGFIVSWQKQTGRVTFMTNYTFSKVLGVRDGETVNGSGNGSAVWPYSVAANYGALSYDHTHIFNAAYVFNMPSPIKGNALLGGAVNGWVLSGITQMQSGPPLQPNTNGDLNVSWPSGFSNTIDLGTNAPTLVPLLTCDPRKGLSSGQYFNPSCFAPPPPGQEGDIIWPYIHGPAFFNSDLAIYKRFAFKEHQRIELRFSAFNFLNHPLPQFGASGNSDINLNFVNSTGGLAATNQNALTTGKVLFDSNAVRRVVEFAVKYNF